MPHDPLDPFADTAAAAPPPEGWDGLARWVRVYSIWQLVLVAGILWGAHFFALLGRPWTTCMVDHTGAMDWRCIAFFHVYEVPIVALLVYHAWYGLRRFVYTALPGYFYLTLFQVVMLAVYVTFEAKVVFDSLARAAPPHEDILLLAGSSGMILGVLLGYYTAFVRLMPFFLRWRYAPRS